MNDDRAEAKKRKADLAMAETGASVSGGARSVDLKTLAPLLPAIVHQPGVALALAETGMAVIA